MVANLKNVSSVFQENFKQSFKGALKMFDKVLFCNFIVAWISSQLPKKKEGLLLNRELSHENTKLIHTLNDEWSEVTAEVITILRSLHCVNCVILVQLRSSRVSHV